jgi:isocitrate dehydrogenase
MALWLGWRAVQLGQVTMRLPQAARLIGMVLARLPAMGAGARHAADQRAVRLVGRASIRRALSGISPRPVGGRLALLGPLRTLGGPRPVPGGAAPQLVPPVPPLRPRRGHPPVGGARRRPRADSPGGHRTEIAIARGDGIGPEIMEAVLAVFEAEGVPLTYRDVEMGRKVYDTGLSAGMTVDARQTVERLGVLFKGPLETPKGKGAKSVNVTARKLWSAFANKRVFKTLPGVDTLWDRAGIDIDITMVRENIEDTYGAIEHMQTHDVAQCRRFTTRPCSLQVHRTAFELARRKGARRITCGHKANIMKITDGLFLETFYEVAKEYPELHADDVIVDAMAMQLASRPQDFDVVVLPNLQGDILSDLCAALVGGLGYAPAANIGENICVFEAVHGTAPDIAGKGLANPTALLLSGCMMLRHMGLFRSAARIEDAVGPALEALTRPLDLCTPAPRPSTMDYARAVIEHLRPVEEYAHLSNETGDVFRVPQRPESQRMMATPKAGDETCEGVDLFVESTESADAVAARIRPLLPAGLRVAMISNRGTQVWPNPSGFTECINHYRVRVERAPGAPAPSGALLLSLASQVDPVVRVCSLEMLLGLAGRRGYSLAQGQ